MKKKICFILAALMTVGMTAFAYAAEKEGISVNGRGVVEVDPDMAIIYGNIETDAETAPEAQSKNNQLSEAVKEAMIKEGIAPDKILTEYSYVSPRTKYDEKTEQFITTGYVAYTSLSFTTNDVDNAGKYYDAALKAGATGASVSFSLENSSLYYGQALAEAVKAADASARSIAKSFGRELGAVTYVEEITSNYSTAGSMKEEAAYDMAMPVEGNGGDSGSVINYDKISVVARINAVYSF